MDDNDRLRAGILPDDPEDDAYDMETGNGAPADLGVWVNLKNLDDYLAEKLPEPKPLYPRLVYVACLTMVYSPHGLGKTLIQHAVAIDMANRSYRVCVIDRDNPVGLFQKRLREWRKSWTGKGRVVAMDRRYAPPLAGRGSQEWLLFPFEQFDALLIDAQDSFLEGTSEKDSDKQGMALATLLDLAHSKGLGIMMLGNVIKSGEHGRYSGVIVDRAELSYEARDARGFTPSGKRPWVEELPLGGAASWAAKAAVAGMNPRVAFANAKDRIGIGVEASPFILEADLKSDPWRVHDVTSEVEGMAAQAVHSKDDQEAAAVAKLAEWLAEAGPKPKNMAAAKLMEHGAGRDRARALLEIHNGKRWIIKPGKGAAKPVYPLSGPSAANQDLPIEPAK